MSRGVVICQGMMGQQRTRRKQRAKNCEPSDCHLFHLEPPVGIVCSLIVFNAYRRDAWKKFQ
jgi:hypothetical protein